jgi:hypothetical protein
MKLKTVVAMALINRFALAFLLFVVEYGKKGRCHGQLVEWQLSFLLLVHKLLESQNFGLLAC